MADVNYSVVDFSDLSAVSDGKTLLYTEGKVCKSENNLSELIQSAVDKQVENKLDTTAFSTVSGNFLTAHQSLDGYATTGDLNTASSTLVDKIDYVSGQVDNKLDTTAAVEIYQPKGDYLTANALDEVSGTWNNVSNIKSFTSIAGIEAETSAVSLQITAGDNVSITTANKTITISAKDTTYSESDFIGASHLSNIQTASGYADDWNTNKSNVELASGYAKEWSDNSATIIANGKSGVSALNTITANSSTWTKVTALSEGSNVKISNNNENYTIGVSGVVTDVKIGNTTIVSDGVATIPENKTVPTVTPTTDQGKVLTVNDSDQIVWATPSNIQISQYNGDVSVINATNDSSLGGYVFDVNIDDSLDTVNVKIDDKQVRKLKVTNPVPSTDDANNGDVLTYDGSTIGWAPVQGGGGGNPYTKVSVTPGERYKNGKTSDYDWELYDQDVSITNNTYAVVSSPIGYTYTTGFPDGMGIDVFKIKLPANTDFPMAVVEFTVYKDDNYNYGAVNDVEVYVGNTKLTRLYSHPFRKDALIGRTLYSNKGQEHITDYGQNYWKIDEIQSSNTLFSKTAFVADADNIPIVQINIFGNCYTVSTNVPGDAPAAS